MLGSPEKGCPHAVGTSSASAGLAAPCPLVFRPRLAGGGSLLGVRCLAFQAACTLQGIRPPPRPHARTDREPVPRFTPSPPTPTSGLPHPSAHTSPVARLLQGGPPPEGAPLPLPSHCRLRAAGALLLRGPCWPRPRKTCLAAPTTHPRRSRHGTHSPPSTHLQPLALLHALCVPPAPCRAALTCRRRGEAETRVLLFELWLRPPHCAPTPQAPALPTRLPLPPTSAGCLKCAQAQALYNRPAAVAPAPLARNRSGGAPRVGPDPFRLCLHASSAAAAVAPSRRTRGRDRT
jgi:hypothetical protein